VTDYIKKDFFHKREITSKLEISRNNVQFVLQDIGVWAPQDFKTIFQDSIVNRGDIGLELNTKKKYLEENLTQLDFDYINEQIVDLAKSNKWTSEIHKDVTLIGLESYDTGNMWIYSTPLFNLEFNFCLLKISYYCGNFCAFSTIYAYKKDKNDSWLIDKMIYSYLPTSNYQLLPKSVLEKDIKQNGICNSKNDSLYIGKQVQVIDKKQMYDYLCQSSDKHIDWPSVKIKNNSGICSKKWDGLKNGNTATIIWRFEKFKSSSGNNIYLIKIEDSFVPIGCSGLELKRNE